VISGREEFTAKPRRPLRDAEEERGKVIGYWLLGERKRFEQEETKGTEEHLGVKAKMLKT